MVFAPFWPEVLRDSAFEAPTGVVEPLARESCLASAAGFISISGMVAGNEEVGLVVVG